MDGKRTWRWWATRLELAIAIGVAALTSFLCFYPPTLAEACLGCTPTSLGPLRIPAATAVPLAALLVLVIGLVWMIRVFRGPRDEPPPWRYRGR